MMKCKKNVLLLFVAFLTASSLYCQVNILNATNPEDIGIDNLTEEEKKNDAMLEYSYVGDRDVLWSTTVWEILDLDEKINQYLYYPTDTLFVGPDRRSLFDVLLKNIREGEVTKVYADSYFNEQITFDDIQVSLTKTDTLDYGFEQLNSGEAISPEYIIKTTISASDIEQYRLKGVWYFDKRYSTLKYRLLGIAPVSKDVNFKSDSNATLVELFWVWYPDARESLHRSKVFNSKNTSDIISFDKVLTTRRFNGMIYKDDNTYDDRPIKDYIHENAYLQMLESRRVKNAIRDREQDMWQY